ncbi:LppP/LprE family lipoprotein [Aphanothece hegewaldii CCALA 016]|uniref:LppP/LprE family lipoprotein n=2 Tax=Aphanothece TaxID=1121 RepID=A0A2T1LV07_9CHRO|nr:LppP/LprE family lipoprotein [Aphanothece hegewaldii CCALA 016]
MVERFDINNQGELKLTYRTKKGIGTLIFVDANRPPAPNSSKTWLNEKKLTNWNQAGTSIPQAPKPQNDPTLMKRCLEGVRRPTLKEDVSLKDNGWMLFGPAQIYDQTTLVTATSDFDGMCRPLKYQAFVFVNGVFAGTLSPQLMDSRTDSSSRPIFLYDTSNLSAEFNRYDEKDALCCPSGVSRVSYQIQRTNDLPVVVPLEVVTQPMTSN